VVPVVVPVPVVVVVLLVVVPVLLMMMEEEPPLLPSPCCCCPNSAIQTDSLLGSPSALRPTDPRLEQAQPLEQEQEQELALLVQTLPTTQTSSLSWSLRIAGSSTCASHRCKDNTWRV
jgi:hypothetical protein